MKLYAIADLHLRHRETREALEALPAMPDDWLIVAGDVGESANLMRWAWHTLTPRFAQLIWVPGNHDLWTLPNDPDPRRGVAKYEHLVSICRDAGVLTPEDPFPRWTGEGSPCTLAPLFLLYDYTFRPDEVAVEKAVAWAAEAEIVCADEMLLYPDPYPSRQAWCRARCDQAEERLSAVEGPTVLINHWPLRQDILTLRKVPRFSIWCGTRRTTDWHLRFDALAVVHGHLHVRATHRRDGIAFEESSLGYPRDWDRDLGVAPYLRQILPIPQGYHELPELTFRTRPDGARLPPP
ncbi:MAG: metallophosphoesterase [Acidobacteriota bacterium]